MLPLHGRALGALPPSSECRPVLLLPTSFQHCPRPSRLLLFVQWLVGRTPWGLSDFSRQREEREILRVEAPDD